MKTQFALEEIINLLGKVTQSMLTGSSLNRQLADYLWHDISSSKSGGMYAHASTIIGGIEDFSFSPWGRVIYVESERIIYCPIPKNATNTIILHIIRKINPSLYLGLRRAARWNPDFVQGCLDLMHSMFQIPDLQLINDSKFNKFVFLREPSERLISAIDDKIVSPFFEKQPRARHENFVHMLLKDYGDKIGREVSLCKLSLTDILNIFKTLPNEKIDKHFLPQIYLIPFPNVFKAFPVSSVDSVLSEILGFRTDKKLYSMNQRRERDMAPTGLTSGDLNILQIPISEWSTKDLQSWSSFRNKDFIRIIRGELSGYLHDDYEYYNETIRSNDK